MSSHSNTAIANDQLTDGAPAPGNSPVVPFSEEQGQAGVEKDSAKHWEGWRSTLGIITSGAGLFSDGYLNGVIGPVNTILRRMYPHEYAHSVASRNVSSIAFLGTVLGQITFGFVVDFHSRKLGMMLASGLLVLFSVLCVFSNGAGGNVHDMFTALTVFRFFLGVGIGGEYPSGSVACAEAAESRKKGKRNRWFVVFTNLSINMGFMASGITPLLLLNLFPEKNSAASHEDYVLSLQPVWRALLGIGAIFPAIILGFRFFWTENGTFRKYWLRNATYTPTIKKEKIGLGPEIQYKQAHDKKPKRIPYRLILKYYWRPLVAISVVWFMYDFGAYAFSIHGSYIVDVATRQSSNTEGDEEVASLVKIFSYTSLLLFFNLPGSLLGAFGSDRFGCQRALLLGAILQTILGGFIAIFFSELQKNLVAFVVLYGLFLSCGEFGPGDNVGLLAVKFCATGVRGRCYGIAAAMGKLGAFVGSWVFPIIVGTNNGGDGNEGMKRAFWVASGMCLSTGLLGMWGVRRVGQEMIEEEDKRFRMYLESQGWVLGEGNEEEGERDAVEMGEVSV